MNNYSVIIFLLIAVFGIAMVSSLQCYQCGSFSKSSVTPCLNFSRNDLAECPPQSTHCAKYVGLASYVYSCEKNCEEKQKGNFETYCCNVNQCNSGFSIQNNNILTYLCSLLLFLTFALVNSPNIFFNYPKV